MTRSRLNGFFAAIAVASAWLIPAGCGTPHAIGPNYEIRSCNWLHILRDAIYVTAQHHHGRLPDLDNRSHMLSEFGPGNPPELFVEPEHGVPYKFNAWLARRNINSIQNQWQTIMIYDEPRGYAHNLRIVAPMRGIIRLVNAAEWQALKRTSHIP